MPNPFISFQTNVPWTNMHGNVSCTLDRHYDVWNVWAGNVQPAAPVWVAGLAALQQIISDAKAAGKRVRPGAGKWSLSDISATPDWLLNTQPLNSMSVGVTSAWIDGASNVNPAHVLFAQCGAQIVEINAALAKQNLSLQTSGASNGQTIAGAIATGTHGAATTVGALHDTVLGLHVVTGDGSTVWIERESRPFASDAFLQHLGATLVRSELIFRAAVVGLGAFGIVHAVALEVEPIYLLERTVRRYEFQDVREILSSLDVTSLNLPDGGTLPFHFQVVFNPNRLLAGGQSAFVQAMYKRPYPNPPPLGTPPTAVTIGASPDLLSFLGKLAAVIPAGVAEAVDLVCKLACPLAERVSQTHRETFGTTTNAEPGVSIELGMAVEDATTVADILVALAAQTPFRGMVGVRYVKSTDALLGFTCHGAMTCTMEIPMPLGDDSLARYDELLTALDNAGVAYTMHWGQIMPAGYDAARVRAAYGDGVDSWVAARQQVLSESARILFSNNVVQRLALDT